MEHGRRKRWFVDARGRPLSARIQAVLRRLVPRTRRRFPSLRDDVALTEVLEDAGQRIARREEHSGPIERIDGYAWLAVKSVANSRMRRASSRLDERTLDPDAAHVVLSSAHAQIGSAEEIESRILLREILARLTPDERFVFARKFGGVPSRRIAEERGSSVSAVDTLFSRAKRKIRTTLGTQQDADTGRRRMRESEAERRRAERRRAELAGERSAEAADG